MIVLDSELSGLNPHKHSLLSIGAVELENPSNQFYGECRIWEGARIEDEALAVNGFSRTDCIDPKRQSDKELLKAFFAWAKSCQNHTIAGENVQLDLSFLLATAERYGINWPFAHRLIDLHSIAYFHMKRLGGIEPPTLKGRSDLNTDKILIYVGIPEEPKPHIGLMGAKVEAEALSRLIFEHSLLPEFSKYPVPNFKTL